MTELKCAEVHIYSLYKLIEYNYAISLCRGLGGSVWITKEKFESMLLERVSDNQVAIFIVIMRYWSISWQITNKDTNNDNIVQYEKFIMSMDRLCAHPYSKRVEDFVMQYRSLLEVKTSATEIPPVSLTLYICSLL